MRDLVAGQGCVPGGGNALSKMVNENAAAMQRQSQLPSFTPGGPPGGHLQQMMGPAGGAGMMHHADMEAVAMAQAFEREAM
eukprot:CAMPEP_0114146002 /NCGR_PEP_ID=MMETSP0043_2-20121206/20339_1 /TAXON_ID=464988 /ORGANISM="Hemiselmis andersenii, Strain CCMP644" /LENGTH=80 /DNA_ID=CAMNT_0001240441 /DNA_START=1 /DNA_END=240 /DNA_ORIENTATION=-